MNSKDTENKAEKGVQLNRRITKLEDSLSITKSLLKESKEKNTKRKISKRLMRKDKEQLIILAELEKNQLREAKKELAERNKFKVQENKKENQFKNIRIGMVLFLLLFSIVSTNLFFESSSITGANIAEDNVLNNKNDSNNNYLEIDDNNNNNNLPAVDLVIDFKDKSNKKIGKTKIIDDNGKYKLEISSDNKPVKSKGVLGLSSDNSNKKDKKLNVTVYGLQNINDNIKVKADVYSGKKPSHIGFNTEVFGMDSVEMDNATIILEKTGEVDAIFHCANFEIDNFDCLDWKTTNIPFIDHGDSIEFTVTHFSAYGGGEINATNADHLDENLTFVSSIFTEIEALDEVWSEAIYQNETVRVTYQNNLTNGSVIDFFARSNNTYALFEVYEFNTTTKVGQSQPIVNEEMSHLTINNLTRNNNIFDFKIIKIHENQEDDTNSMNDSIVSFIEFDYIHDALVNTTLSSGMIAYSQLNTNTPIYRIWNSTNYSEEYSDTTDVGSNFNWLILKANHERDEMIMGVIDQLKDTHIEIYSDNGQGWNNYTEIATTLPSASWKGFDIDYEDIDGEAVIVYEYDTGGNGAIAYRTWNGSNLSSQQTYSYGTSANANMIKTFPKKNSDDIMVLISDSQSDLHAILWNGTSMTNSTNSSGGYSSTLSTRVSSTNELHFEFAWETLSGDGIATYGEGSDIIYRSYYAENQSWSDAVTMFGVNTALDVSKMCSDPYSDYIGLIYQDANTNSWVNATMWDGTQILSGFPAGDPATEGSGSSSHNIDCSFYNKTSALFSYVDINSLDINYFGFQKPNSWALMSLSNSPSTPAFASDDIASMQFYEHPTKEEIMIVTQDIAEDLDAIVWNRTNFLRTSEPVLDSTLEVFNGNQIGAMFAWDSYDTVPNVTGILPQSGSYNADDVVGINATVFDNVAVSTVIANVTLPDLSIEQITLIDDDGDNIFNGTFSSTASTGDYTIIIIANDSSTHLNINQSETGSFTVAAGGDAIIPAVTTLVPVVDTQFNTSQIIEIATNVTDAGGVAIVYANLTLPNGSAELLNLSNSSGAPDKFNISYTIPILAGNYNVTILANDTSNNLNNTETTNFTVKIGCGTITASVILDQNVYSTGTCFTTGADHIEIDGAGYKLQGDGTNYGIYINQNSNVTIKNFARIDNFTFGIYANNFAPTIMNQIRNNTIGENITTSGAGIGLANVSNYNITNNSITISVSNTDAIAIFNQSLMDKVENITIENNIINVTASGDEAITVLSSNNILIFNNSIYLSAASGNGINVNFGSVNISENTLVGSSTATNVIKISSNNLNATVSNNNITVSGSPTGILIDGNYTTANRNIITAYGTGNCLKITGQHGNYLSNNCNLSASGPSPASTRQGLVISGGKNNTLQSNDFYSNGTYAYPVLIFFGASDNRLISNNITAIKSASPALLISATGGVPADNVFQNNTIYSPMSASIYDLSGLSTTNVLSYYNNFGEINWTRNNLTTSNVQIGIGTNVYLENNLVGLADNAGLVNLNVSAKIRIKGLSDTVAPQLLKSGVRCDDTDICNISYDVTNKILAANVSSFSNYTTQSNVGPPNVTRLLPINNSAYNTSQVIEIAANVTTLNHIDYVLANLTLPNGSAELLNLSNSSGAPDKFNISYTIPNVKGDYNITIFANDTSNNLNNTETTNFTVSNRLPPIPVPIYLTDGNNTINRTPEFTWNVSVDPDGDNVTYRLEIDDNPGFNNPEVNVSSITNTTPDNVSYLISTILDVDIPYYWRVLANDTTGYSGNSSIRNFTVDSFLAITIKTSFVNFTTLNPGDKSNTTSGTPAPFLAENTGNVLSNVTITGNQFFSAVNFPSTNYQFKIRENEVGAISTALSNTTFINMNTTYADPHVQDFDWRGNIDDFYVDLLVNVPTDESPGEKTSAVTFTISR